MASTADAQHRTVKTDVGAYCTDKTSVSVLGQQGRNARWPRAAFSQPQHQRKIENNGTAFLEFFLNQIHGLSSQSHNIP